MNEHADHQTRGAVCHTEPSPQQRSADPPSCTARASLNSLKYLSSALAGIAFVVATAHAQNVQLPVVPQAPSTGHVTIRSSGSLSLFTSQTQSQPQSQPQAPNNRHSHLCFGWIQPGDYGAYTLIHDHPLGPPDGVGGEWHGYCPGDNHGR